MEEQTCVVCDSIVDDLGLASCQYCGGPFHQPWKTGDDGPCGRIVSHGEALALAYICNKCYSETEE